MRYVPRAWSGAPTRRLAVRSASIPIYPTLSHATHAITREVNDPLYRRLRESCSSVRWRFARNTKFTGVPVKGIDSRNFRVR